MLRPLLFSAAAVLVTLAASNARAQNFQGGGAAFDPEIDIVESGALLDVQATVSADRKYVTMTARPQLSTLIALREFTFQAGGSGTVGFNNNGQNNGQGQNANGLQRAGGVGRGANGGRNGPLLPALARPVEPKPATPVLHREGMTRVDAASATPPPAATTAAPATRPAAPTTKPSGGR